MGRRINKMKIGLISDVHSNIVALYAVMRELDRVDAVVCAGDVVGYNPWPGKAIDYLREHEIPTVMGNHDRAVVTGDYGWFNTMGQAGVEHSVEELQEEQMEWLAALPESQLLFDGRVRIVHDHPDRRGYYTYPPDFAPDLLDTEEVLVLGHTHVQHAETYPEGIVVNPGSVGQPRDEDPRAAFAVLDLDEPGVELHRTEYAIGKVQHEIRERGLPDETADRLASGR